jgi:uncharacterized membrane protein
MKNHCSSDLEYWDPKFDQLCIIHPQYSCQCWRQQANLCVYRDTIHGLLLMKFVNHDCISDMLEDVTKHEQIELNADITCHYSFY